MRYETRLTRRQRQARADCRFFALLAFVAFVLAALSGFATVGLWPMRYASADASLLVQLCGLLAFFSASATVCFVGLAIVETRDF